MRQAEITRNTAETQITLAVNLDAQTPVDIQTGVGFFDHMLTLFASHGRMSLVVKANGDLHVDSHHTVEDIGIALAHALHYRHDFAVVGVLVPNALDDHIGKTHPGLVFFGTVLSTGI